MDHWTIPAGLATSVDPVEGNPFSADDPRHDTWRQATLDAESAHHRFNVQLLEVGERLARFGTRGHHAYLLDLVAGKFDIWVNRNLSVIRLAEELPAFDTWVMSFAQAWLDLIRADLDVRQLTAPTDLQAGNLAGALKTRLVQRMEYWRADARDWVRQWEQYSSQVRASQQSAEAVAEIPPAPQQRAVTDNQVSGAIEPFVSGEYCDLLDLGSAPPPIISPVRSSARAIESELPSSPAVQAVDATGDSVEAAPVPVPPLLTLQRAAEMLGVHEDTIKANRSGNFPRLVKIGRSLRVEKAAVLRMIGVWLLWIDASPCNSSII